MVNVNDSNRVFAGGGDVCSEHDDCDDWEADVEEVWRAERFEQRLMEVLYP